MSNISLIISDIDGTILDKNHQVDPQLIDLIPQLQEKTIPFVLASARSPLGMKPIAQELGLKDNPLACYNGALVVKGDDIIIQHPVDKAEIQTLLDYLFTDFPTVSVNIYSGQDWITDKMDIWSQLEGQITEEKALIRDFSTMFADQAPAIHKLLLIDEADVIQELYQKLQALNFPQTAFYLSKDNYLEVTGKDVSKEHALIEIAKHYHIPLEKVMTIGDNFNDLPMLELAGLGVAMANAPEAVQKKADAVTSSNDQHGVAEALKQYVL